MALSTNLPEHALSTEVQECSARLMSERQNHLTPSLNFDVDDPLTSRSSSRHANLSVEARKVIGGVARHTLGLLLLLLVVFLWTLQNFLGSVGGQIDKVAMFLILQTVNICR